MERVFAESKQEHIAVLSAEESAHMAKVMRKQIGDQLEVIADGALYLGSIVDDNKKGMQVELVERLPTDTEPRTKVTLFQGLPKGSKMELIIQKCVEIGISAIVPVDMARTVKKGVQLERWNRVSREACKQCKRVIVPEVKEATTIDQIDVNGFDLFLIAYEDEHSTSIKEVLQAHPDAQSIGLLVGPEGGIAQTEVETLRAKGAKTATLGKRILRTETAGMAACAVILYERGDMEA